MFYGIVGISKEYWETPGREDGGGQGSLDTRRKTMIYKSTVEDLKIYSSEYVYLKTT